MTAAQTSYPSYLASVLSPATLATSTPSEIAAYESMYKPGGSNTPSASSTIPGVPNLSVSDVLQADPSAGSQAGAAQGAGSSYLSMLPAFLQASYNSGNGGIGPDMAQNPAYQWLTSNGYLTGDAQGGSVGLGWKAAGVGPGGTYNPKAVTNVGGQGFGADQGNQNLQEVGANPFGVSTEGALDVHNIQSPTQSPTSFGSNELGPTVNKANVASNQDAWSKYIVPLMQIAAAAGYGGLGGFGDLGGVGSALFKQAGGMVNNGASSFNPVSTGVSLAKLYGTSGA